MPNLTSISIHPDAAPALSVDPLKSLEKISVMFRIQVEGLDITIHLPRTQLPALLKEMNETVGKGMSFDQTAVDRYPLGEEEEPDIP